MAKADSQPFFVLERGLLVNLNHIVWIREDDKQRLTIFADGPQIAGDYSYTISDPKVAASLRKMLGL